MSPELERVAAYLGRLVAAEYGPEEDRPRIDRPPFRVIRSYEDSIFKTEVGRCVTMLLHDVRLLEALPNVEPFPVIKLTPRYRSTEHDWVVRCLQIISEWRIRNGFPGRASAWTVRAQP